MVTAFAGPKHQSAVSWVDVVYENRVGVLVRFPVVRGQLYFLGTAISRNTVRDSTLLPYKPGK